MYAPKQPSQSRIPVTEPKTNDNQHATGSFKVPPPIIDNSQAPPEIQKYSSEKVDIITAKLAAQVAANANTQAETAPQREVPELGLVQRMIQNSSPRARGSSIQTKLTVGEPGDKYEQEADSMARSVMSMPDSALQRQTSSGKQIQTSELGLAQRMIQNSIPRASNQVQKLTPLGGSIQKKVQAQLIQRASNRSFQPGGNIESQLNSSQGTGNPLSEQVRAYMEPRFGTDFSQVRVHTGESAVQMNQELGAQAFTHGSDVYFGAGKSPGNNELTAHELTHVVQQTGAVQPKYNVEQQSEPTTESATVSGQTQDIGIQRACSKCESEQQHVEEDKEGGMLQAKNLPGQTSIIPLNKGSFKPQQWEETKNPLQAKKLPEQTSEVAPDLKINEPGMPQESKTPTAAESVENEQLPQGLKTDYSEQVITSEPPHSDEKTTAATSTTKEQASTGEVGKSDKPKVKQSVEIVTQHEESPSATLPTSEAKADGSNSPATEAIKAVKPQEQVQLPKEVTALAKGEQTNSKASAGKANEGDGQDPKVPFVQALKEATAKNEVATPQSEDSNVANLQAASEKQEAKDVTEQGKAQLAATNAQAQQLASAGINFAPSEAEADGQGEETVISMKAENSNSGSAVLKERSIKASGIASSFLANASGKVQTITGLGIGIPVRIQAAAENAKATITTAVEQQKTAVTAHIAQQRAKATSEAQATIAKIQAQYQAAIAAIPQETAKARQQVESEYTISVQAVDASEKSQITEIEGIYKQAADEFRNAGKQVGGDAVKIANKKASDYKSRDSGAAQVASFFGLGAVSDVAFGTDTLKNKARAQAAESVGQAYQKNLISTANEYADQAQQGKQKDIEIVRASATKSREALQTQHQTAFQGLIAAEQQSQQQAQQMQTQPHRDS